MKTGFLKFVLLAFLVVVAFRKDTTYRSFSNLMLAIVLYIYIYIGYTDNYLCYQNIYDLKALRFMSCGNYSFCMKKNW